MITLQNLVNAVACAAAVLEGTDGGYSPREKDEAKATLLQLKNELIQQAQTTALQLDQISVKQEFFIGKAEVV